VEVTVFISDELQSIIDSSIDDGADAAIQAANEALLKANWLTPGIIREIEAVFPSTSDIVESTRERDMNAFAANVGRLFFKDRMFASLKQLAQSASSRLLDAWAVSTTSTGKQIRCFYSHRPQRKPDVHVHTPYSQRNYPSKKTGCPLAIRFQYVELCCHQEKKMSLIFHRVRITSVVLDHNCKPSVVTHRLARESGGRVKINLSTFHSVLMLLFHNPNMSMAVLRPILSKYLPHWKNVLSQFVCNFRKR
jgi:hypothetical protein